VSDHDLSASRGALRKPSRIRAHSVDRNAARSRGKETGELVQLFTAWLRRLLGNPSVRSLDADFNRET
jgi:hypothetical protein